MWKQVIILMWTILMTSGDFQATDNEEQDNGSEQLMQSAGYPKPGDIPVLNRKIFKGQRVSIREHPYVASVRRMVSHYVTAALLTKNLVITVAHTLNNVPVTELTVVLGENYSDRGSTLLTVVLMIIHEDFEPYTLKNDIAMLRFYEDVNYKGNIKPIALTPPMASLTGEKAFVTGWGRCDNMGIELCLDRSSKYYPDEKMDHMLRTVSFTMNFPNYYCEGYKRHDVTISAGMLCTGVAREEDQVCPCLGVPGALLVAGARLTGILSWGFGCGFSYDLPLIYTNLQYFSSWIAHNIRTIRVISQTNLTNIFHATKAAVLAQWLIETRIITPKLYFRQDKNVEPLPIDHHIMKLRGTIYDVRDFINGGSFHKEKVEMYNNLRSDFEKLHNTTPKKPTTNPRPFLGNETLKEIEVNFNHITPLTTVSTETTSEDDSVAMHVP